VSAERDTHATSDARLENGDRALVDGVQALNRALALIAGRLVDVGLALVEVNVAAGPQGSPSTIGALNDLHAAQDEIAAMQRTMMGLLENVRARIQAEA
jgi:hypothetical protein